MRPRPNSSTPTLLLMVLRFLTPFFTSARIRFSGIPHSPNPPTMMVAPSLISATASSAFANTLLNDMVIFRTGDCTQRRGGVAKKKSGPKGCENRKGVGETGNKRQVFLILVPRLVVAAI